MKTYLETERVTLREFVPDDINAIADLDSSPSVMQFFSDGVPSSDEIISKTIDSFLKWPERAGGLYGYWLAQTKENKEFIGWFQLRPLKEDIENYDNLEIGYRLKEKFWGQGIATEVSKALINKAFNDIGANEIWAITMKNNLASQKVMKKCGLRFQREDIFSEYPGKDKRCVWYRLKNNFKTRSKLDSLYYRKAKHSDAKAAAKLHAGEDPELYESLISVFQDEFKKCEKSPDAKCYFLAFCEKELIAFAGARFYDKNDDENMYKTKTLLPSGWYLRGMRVHQAWQRLGIARKLTQLRLEWLSERTKKTHVFLTDEKKETIPMYEDFGFLELSRGWTYSSPEITKKGLLLQRVIT